MNMYYKDVLQRTRALCTHSKQCGMISLTDVQHCHQKKAPFNIVWRFQISILSHLKHLTYSNHKQALLSPVMRF